MLSAENGYDVHSVCSPATLNMDRRACILLRPASAFVSYIGPFSHTFRKVLLEENWIPFLRSAVREETGEKYGDTCTCWMASNFCRPSPSCGFCLGISQDADVNDSEPHCNGLPADAFSVENGCIFCNTTRWPLLIDPQLQVSASSGALGQTTSRP